MDRLVELDGWEIDAVFGGKFGDKSKCSIICKVVWSMIGLLPLLIVCASISYVVIQLRLYDDNESMHIEVRGDEVF